MTVRVAIDIGGTFTDATLIDEESGRVSIAKIMTTPADPSEGFMTAVERALAEAGADAARWARSSTRRPSRRTRSSRGTIARSGFVTTEGFRDLLEIARQVRPSLYDTQLREAAAARPARPRRRRDRAARAGGRDRDRRSTRAPSTQPRRCSRREQVESVAVCLLHSYVNPEHERRVGEILARGASGHPGLALLRGRARVPRVYAGQSRP